MSASAATDKTKTSDSVPPTTKGPVRIERKASSEERQHQRDIVVRDTTFIALGLIAASVLSWMELHAGEAEFRGEGSSAYVDDKRGIIDTGYILTSSMHNFLKANRGWNDFFAFLNTVLGVVPPGIYFVHQTLWVGDYEPVFRYLAISVLRSLCGWFTYLPPDDSYLMSNYDFPDIAQCLTKECGDPALATEINPFVSFFSGHVATLVITANHMYLKGYKKLAIFFHVVNALQIVRLLATRGHYSIDIIIGWYMAVSISKPAGRLGRHFSRGDDSIEKHMPASATEAFEYAIGVDETRTEARMSMLMKREDVKEALLNVKDQEEVFAEPTVRLAMEGKLEELEELIATAKSEKAVDAGKPKEE
ncbi:expressed unknown protein [Seminavis robusta]|uniref:AtPDCT1/2 transmembrane domain-containing protein n=1 Tax=Seminavis robusta TaxID=568900 RepID=A0A9N8DCY1_9STRA|nr:expressed unknown protein [Seminavis robusta]|eukprot:Sro38_g023670.1 n/a (363) ;mRNA; r:58040-59238